MFDEKHCELVSGHIHRGSALRATSDRAFLAYQSWVIADLVARFYGELSARRQSAI